MKKSVYKYIAGWTHPQLNGGVKGLLMGVVHHGLAFNLTLLTDVFLSLANAKVNVREPHPV